MAFASQSGLLNDPFEPIPKIVTVFDAMQVMRKTCLVYGFRYFSVITLRSIISGGDASLSELATISSWPPDLIANYDRLELARNSPILDQLRKQITPLEFHVEMVNTARPGDEPANANELFARFGLTTGVYFPVQDSNGLRQAVSFIGNRAPLSAQELSMLALFSTMLVEQMSRISAAEIGRAHV